tara:strand:+ start:5057 stop:5776 length:720 start_codon:yes stop_codon:yes gene_type:complete
MIEDTLKKRTNITFFSKKVPEKQVIKDILEKAQQLTPHKNNFWHYELAVYGPEHAEQKKMLALSTVCNEHLKYYRQDNLKDEDWRKLKQAYNDWIDYHNGDQSKDYVMKDKWHFNEQVTAPYLLAYYPSPIKIRESQTQDKYFTSGRAKKVFRSVTSVSTDEFNQQSGMNAMVITMLAIEKGLDVSYTKCYFYNQAIHTDIMARGKPAFLLGIGYEDKTKRHYKTKLKKPTIDEVIKWQ